MSWQTNREILRLAEEMASDGIRPEREPFGFGSALHGSFLEVPVLVQRHFVHGTYKLRKHTNHMAAK